MMSSVVKNCRHPPQMFSTHMTTPLSSRSAAAAAAEQSGSGVEPPRKIRKYADASPDWPPQSLFGSFRSVSGVGDSGYNSFNSPGYDRNLLVPMSLVLPQSIPSRVTAVLLPTLQLMVNKEPESLAFRHPVDPEKLYITNYNDIIMQPMDLGTIRTKLLGGAYKDPWDYISDVYLMFENAWLYNQKVSRVYKYSTKLCQVFEAAIDPAMRRLGYCCGRKYTYTPQKISCWGERYCVVQVDEKYYSYQNDKYLYCVKCFNEAVGDTLTVTCADDLKVHETIKRTDFVEVTNNRVELEPFVKCKSCGKKMHQICVLHSDLIYPEGFTCDGCLNLRLESRPVCVCVAKRLVTSKLGDAIEARVSNFLKSKGITTNDVTIRVVSTSEKTLEIKPNMKRRYVDGGKLSAAFPYRFKTIFAFQNIDGVDVCFFGMHVQEYGSDCPEPNARRVYIGYLDSVHYFTPKQFRTDVYHEILLGYLAHVKSLGFIMAHLWACPPADGDDYIFHRHPPQQKVPKPKRLQEWYKKLLDKAIAEKTIIEYKDILKQAQSDGFLSPTELPCFEGDFWPSRIEDLITELEEEEEEKRKEAALSDINNNGDDGEGATPVTKKKERKKPRKSNKSKAYKKGGNDFSPALDDELSVKIINIMEKHKDGFFIIRLHTAKSAEKFEAIHDTDEVMSSDLMDTRDGFLGLARDHRNEFATLRRAKAATMAMLYVLLHQADAAFVYTCNNCKVKIESSISTRYECDICVDFDLCAKCFETLGHVHHMEKIVRLGNSTRDILAREKISFQYKLKTTLENLVHASHCDMVNCERRACTKLKVVIDHVSKCKTDVHGGCKAARQLLAVIYHHSRRCVNVNCGVRFCPIVKRRIGRQDAILEAAFLAEQKCLETYDSKYAAGVNKMGFPKVKDAEPNYILSRLGDPEEY